MAGIVCASCAVSSRPIAVSAAASVASNLSAGDTALVTIEGCGTFYDSTLPQRYAIVLVAVRDEQAWTFNSWEVVRESLHGPPLPCASRAASSD